MLSIVGDMLDSPIVLSLNNPVYILYISKLSGLPEHGEHDKRIFPEVCTDTPRLGIGTPKQKLKLSLYKSNWMYNYLCVCLSV